MASVEKIRLAVTAEQQLARHRVQDFVGTPRTAAVMPGKRREKSPPLRPKTVEETPRISVRISSPRQSGDALGFGQCRRG